MSRTEGFVVIADFKVRPDAVDAFVAAMERHARRCLAAEPGCLQFDVTRDAEDPARVLLYEVYADAAAYEAHRAAPHMAQTRADIEGLVVERRIATFDRLHHPRKPTRQSGKVLVAPALLAAKAHLMQPLEAAGLEVVYNRRQRSLGEQDMIELLPGVVATIAGAEPYNERTLAAGRELRCVARLGVGYDQVDIAAATRHGVAVAMAFGTNHEPVADHALALMAALAHRVVRYHEGMREGRWDGEPHGRLHGTTVGIVGFGRIGRALAKRCQGFGMTVLVADPVMDAETVARLGCRLVPLDELLADADWVSLHAPATPDTLRLIDARRLALMKPGAHLINTARGALVDEAALVEALRQSRIAGAGLDVFAVEPLPSGSPLLGLLNVVLTPHVAGSSDWSVDTMARRCVESILAVLRGEDPGGGLVLNPEAVTRPTARAGV